MLLGCGSCCRGYEPRTAVSLPLSLVYHCQVRKLDYLSLGSGESVPQKWEGCRIPAGEDLLKIGRGNLQFPPLLLAALG